MSGWNMDYGKITMMKFRALSEHLNFSLDTPLKDLSEDIINMLLYGINEKIKMIYDTDNFSGTYYGSYEGIINNLMRRYRETQSDYIKRDIERYMVSEPCEECHGARLKKSALAVKVGGMNIYDLCNMSINNINKFIDKLKLNERKAKIAEQIIKKSRRD